MLNSIGLDNDGIEAFIEHHLPYLRELPTAIIVSIAGRTHDEFVEMAAAARRPAGRRGDRTQHLLPERRGRRRFRHRSGACAAGWSAVPQGDCRLPIIAKLTPNVTSIADDRQGGGRRRAPMRSR